MREEGFDDKIGKVSAAFSFYMASVIGRANVLARENIISLAIKVSFIFLEAMIILIAVSFLMFGSAQGLSKALRVDLWFGFLIAGTGFLLPTLLIFMFIPFGAKKKLSKKKDEQKKATETLSRKVSEIIDIRTWVQEYPFYSTGAAAAAGFTLGEAVTPATSMESNKAETTSEPHSADIQASIIAMILVLAENVLKDAVVPFFKEHLKPKDHKHETDSCQGRICS